MKFYQLAIIASFVFTLDAVVCNPAHAQDASSAAQAQVAASAPAPVAQAPVAVLPPPAPAIILPAPVVSVPAVAAPPSWATDILAVVSGLPVVGPYLSKALLYLGIIAAILTTLVAAALSILASLKGAFSWAGLDTAASAIQSFQTGQVMYWLTYFSNFNAKKPSA